jgi:hypothetical protein
MKLTQKDKKFLMGMIPLLLVLSTYFFAFNPLKEEVFALQTEVGELATIHQTLLQKQGEKEHYKEQTLILEKKFDAYLQKFDNTITQSKDILLIDTLERSVGIEITQMESMLVQPIEDASIFSPKRNVLQVQFTSNYKELKEVLSFIQAYSGRLVLIDLSAQKIANEDNFYVSLVLSQYVLSREREITSVFVNQTAIGKQNIFE